jgi:predicted alpha/beta-hydrolase family hydrolase
VACRTAVALGVRGVVCLAFPLHLPGRPEKSRTAELLTADAPRLVLQGTRDSFGTPEELRAAMGAAPGIRIVELPGADHGFRVAKGAPVTAAELRARVVAEVSAFVR